MPIAISRPGWSVNAFSASGTPGYLQTGMGTVYPNRHVVRPSIDSKVLPHILEEWAHSVGLVLGPLVPTGAARHKVLCLFYHYGHLNGTDLKVLPCTDLITHRVRIKPGTRPSSNTTQKRWPAHTEW